MARKRGAERRSAPEFTSGADAPRSTAPQGPRARGRHRIDPHTGLPSRFTLVSADQARAALRRFMPVGTEVIAVRDAAGRVLARDVRAAMDVPHFARAYMDGYAVRAADTRAAAADAPARLRIVGTVEMGRAAPCRIGAGEACRIPTGGMLPAGADAVVMVEHTTESAAGAVEVHQAARAGQHVMRRGEDVRRGRVVFRKGHRCRPQDVGALAGIGVARLAVYRRPRVAILATGDEIVAPEITPAPGQVRSINQFSLAAMVAAAGGIPVDLGVVPDRRALLVRALARGLRAADLVLISGGSSVGTRDLTPEVIRAMPRARIVVHGIRIKPGKPTVIAEAAGKPILGLPGHPVSALVIFEVFGAALLRMLGGEPPARAFTPTVRAPALLSTPITSQAGREDWVRVALEESAADWSARPLPGGSAEIFGFVHADGMVRIPAEVDALPAGTRVVVRLHSR